MGLNGGYSGFRILREGLTGNRGWRPAWRDPAPQPAYDFVIVGGGGHGLATAYYLASQFGEASVAVLEKGWIGGGNVGRNTTIIRSNYLLDGNQPFYEFSLKLWEGLEQDFNYNAMVSQRGVYNIYHSDGQRDAYRRRGNAMILNGADAELLDAEQLRGLDLIALAAAQGLVEATNPPRRGTTRRCEHSSPAAATAFVPGPTLEVVFLTAGAGYRIRYSWTPMGRFLPWMNLKCRSSPPCLHD